MVFLALMFIFRSACADWNHVPTGSMKPTILEGDYILVDRMAYDLRLPFTHISLARLGEPQRGDIVVFDSEASDNRLVKRVIGIPGDTVALHNNRLSINGESITYEPAGETSLSRDMRENLSGIEHLVRLRKGGSAMDSFAPVRIPRDSYLVLGDNRDNSADSRVIGLVPRREILGRTRSVLLSLDYDNYFLPRSDRFLQAL
nr:signal peptidase I [Microbulbifer sp. GX H0434]